uniref:Pentacotripeptide-repeat region of PRORP domain-containing protein n=1 Tax=Chaetoceros debilis TaxID=122233 RepID=A0A7S3Q844_9STRA
MSSFRILFYVVIILPSLTGVFSFSFSVRPISTVSTSSVSTYEYSHRPIASRSLPFRIKRDRFRIYAETNRNSNEGGSSSSLSPLSCEKTREDDHDRQDLVTKKPNISLARNVKRDDYEDDDNNEKDKNVGKGFDKNGRGNVNGKGKSKGKGKKRFKRFQNSLAFSFHEEEANYASSDTKADSSHSVGEDEQHNASFKSNSNSNGRGHGNNDGKEDTASSSGEQGSTSTSLSASGINPNSWLDQATADMLDKSRIPLGQLTADDVESITGLMANLAKRKSAHSSIFVERLLKRVVDECDYLSSSAEKTKAKLNTNSTETADVDADEDVDADADVKDNGAHTIGEGMSSSSSISAVRPVDDVHVNTRMYTIAIDSWAKTGGKLAAERASEIHQSMVRAYRASGDRHIRPSTISYNAVINAWSKSGCNARAAVMAEGILNTMLDEWRRREAENKKNGNSNNETSTSVIGDMDDLRYDRKMLTKEEQDERMMHSVVKPDVVSFTSVIDTWAKSGDRNGAARAMNLLKQMEKLYVEEGEQGMKPNVYTYSACINAFAKSTDSSAPMQAEALLADMKKAYEAGDMEVQPNVVNYNSVINSWGRCKKPGSAQQAADILYSMEDEGVEPDSLSYSLVVSAWAHSTAYNATQKAEAALDEMENWVRDKNKAIDEAFDHGLSNHAIANGMFDKDGDTTPSSLPAIRVHLDVECYNTVLIALSKRQEPNAPDRAIAILNKMQKLADEGFETVRPTPKSWNSVLNTLSRACDEDSTRRAEQLLNDMDDAGVHPDVFSYAALLHAYQKNASAYAAQRADDVVRKMEQLYYDGVLSSAPDVYHYTIVCACWARSGESIAAQRCFEILQHMEGRVKSGYADCKPNTRTYNAVIDSYARGHHVDEAEILLDDMINKFNAGDRTVKPDGFTFNAVINAWTRCRRKGCGHRAELILKKLLEFHESGNQDVTPDSRSFSHIIDYYSRSSDPHGGKKAEFLLQGMIKMYEKGYRHVLPSMFSFTAVISTYARSKNGDAGLDSERVLHLLEAFHRKHKISSLKPNTFVVNTALHAWSKSGHPMSSERVENILSHMESQYCGEGNNAMQPNTRSCGLVPSILVKSAHSMLSLA